MRTATAGVVGSLRAGSAGRWKRHGRPPRPALV